MDACVKFLDAIDSDDINYNEAVAKINENLSIIFKPLGTLTLAGGFVLDYSDTFDTLMVDGLACDAVGFLDANYDAFVDAVKARRDGILRDKAKELSVVEDLLDRIERDIL